MFKSAVTSVVHEVKTIGGTKKKKRCIKMYKSIKMYKDVKRRTSKKKNK